MFFQVRSCKNIAYYRLSGRLFRLTRPFQPGIIRRDPSVFDEFYYFWLHIRHHTFESMKKNKLVYAASVLFVLLTLSSCHTSRPFSSNAYAMKEISGKLGVTVTAKDYLPLYREAATWVGAPYRHGGTTRKGTDCSGLVGAVYRNVYGVKLNRSSADIQKKDCRPVKKSKLKAGDLVFFNTSGKRRKTTHVGIYLKEGRFIHSSTSKGVRVSSLNETYYKRHWRGGGRVKR